MSRKSSGKDAYLEKTPKIPGVNGLCNFVFLEYRNGKRDASENQIRKNGDGHISPYIADKVNCCDIYVDRVYLITSRNLEPTVKEANSLVVELNLILSDAPQEVAGTGEDALRQAAAAAAARKRNETRRKEILERIAEIRAQSDMVDESLKHHIERAEGILHSRLSKYWRGVLSVSDGELEHFPQVEHRKSTGREKYVENRQKLLGMIDNAIKYGGGAAYEA